ncbi:MAG: immunoglobulin domain-containing protein [Verrucomicrobia bacterium]|nr:immunoglobulin domain-containing protein [Verrucomicrobiota bacterium]
MKPTKSSKPNPSESFAVFVPGQHPPRRGPFKRLVTILLTFAALLGVTSSGLSQITVKVDSTKNWVGWMNYLTTDNAWFGGQAWGTADLRASFVPDQANASRLVLRVNTNSYNPADPAWNLPDGTPTRHLEANFYVEEVSALGGNELTFTGMVESNSIPAGWTCFAVIKEFGPGYAWIGLTDDPLVGGSPFSVTRSIGAGNIVQYGFMITFGGNTAPDSAVAFEGVSVLVDNADPAITGQPANQRVVFGETATFSVVASGSSALSYQWQRYETNLVNGGNISGATSATLTVSNAQADDATSYNVTVSSTAGSIDSQSVRLRVLTPAEFANALDNPSFELDVVTPTTVPEPWVNFTGSALQNTNNLYAWPSEQNVKTIQGTNVVQVYNGGEWNGIYQDVPAAPGDIFTGDCWLWQSSFDPLTAPVNEAFLEVQFRAGAANPIAIYNSAYVTNATELHDIWLFLQATNGVAEGYAQTTTTDAQYLVAPPGTEFVRFQITLHAVGGGPGSVYVDATRLMRKLPVTVDSSVSGGNIELSWLSQGDTDYQVVYKDSLSDPDWMPLGELIAGDGTVKTASYTTAGSQRYYQVLTK